MPDSKIELAFLCGGKLYFVDSDGQQKTHESRFANEAIQRTERSRTINDWKSDTDAWGSQNMMFPGMPQFQSAAQPQAPTQFTNIASGEDDLVCYSMSVFGAGGLFRYDLNQQTELRLMHANAFRPDGLAVNPNDGTLAFGLAAPDGTVNLKTKRRDRPQQKQLTAGDTCDECPTWQRIDDTDYVYFHSTGIGRNQAGIAVGRGPGSICRIGLEAGDVETILEDSEFDYLQPKFDGNGNLHVIRRRYKRPEQQHAPSLLTVLTDIVMLPYRILRMLFFFANFLSMMFVGKPLTSDFFNATPETQTQQRLLWGQVIKTQKRIRKKGQAQRLRLVPEDWELLRIDKSGVPQTLAKHVMSFDVGAESQVVYSDGSGIYQIDQGGETKLSSTSNVSQIAILRRTK